MERELRAEQDLQYQMAQERDRQAALEAVSFVCLCDCCVR